VFIGTRANEQQVKTMDLSRYKVIAFATHGLAPGDLDGLLQPALALSSPAVAGIDGDGLLTMQAQNPLLTRAEALRQSMLFLIDVAGHIDPESGKVLFSYAHPIFWAAFSLIGN
jgi:CHAT domain-containing protein